jgi:hypothetical protein
MNSIAAFLVNQILVGRLGALKYHFQIKNPCRTKQQG